MTNKEKFKEALEQVNNISGEFLSILNKEKKGSTRIAFARLTNACAKAQHFWHKMAEERA